jgi:hypothetical protein
MNPTDRTADATYQARRANITGLLDGIKIVLQAHSERQAAHPDNWAFTADLDSTEEQLKQVLLSLSGDLDYLADQS